MLSITRPACPEYLLPYLADKKIKIFSALMMGAIKAGLESSLGRKNYLHLWELMAKASGSKCWYCMRPVTHRDSLIDQFRPVTVMGEQKLRSSSVYAHLAMDWRNLYLSCARCHRYKANRFPVSGNRASFGMSYNKVVKVEIPLLLDPCNDSTENHIRIVGGSFIVGLTEQGTSTIRLLALDREDLVLERRKSLVLRKYSHTFLSSSISSFSPNKEPAYLTSLAKIVSNLVSDKPLVPASVGLPDTPIATNLGEGMETYKATSRYLERVQITNFGAIHRLDLNLASSQSLKAPCFALLGENGVGKSSVLRAIALALGGKAYAKRLRASSDGCLAAGALEGEVRLTIAGREQEIVMKFRHRKPLEFLPENSEALVIGYGATRLLPQGRHKSRPGETYAKVDNLFNPFLPLTDPSKWLLAETEDRWIEVNQVLAKLLPDGHKFSVAKNDGKVWACSSDGSKRLIKHLSDGYQCMIGMAVDIIEVMSLGYESMESAEGIVLIDELGNHFHPAWRLHCLGALRDAFPRIQFIYSTHDPLCLRGLTEGEVTVLKRDKMGQIYALEDLPPVEQLRVEQLLTSEHFGLKSTVDPEMERSIRRYEALAIQPNRTDEEDREYQGLVKSLTDERYLGTTRRERLALQLLDVDSIPEIPVSGRVSAKNLSQATVQKLRWLLKEIKPVQDAES